MGNFQGQFLRVVKCSEQKTKEVDAKYLLFLRGGGLRGSLGLG